MATHSDPNDKRVAVVAVHGVGSPEKGETLRQVVELLQRSSHNCAPFAESALHISVAPLTAHSFPRTPAMPDTQFSYRAIQPDLAHTDGVRRYRTLKISGRLETGSASREVDCYEMYWEDFSSVSRNTPRILAELYQLLFHLASLGRKTVLASCESPPAAAQRTILAALGGVHRLIAALLPTSIPIGNLYLVPMFLPLLALALSPESAGIAAACLAGLIAFAMLYRTAYAVAKPDLGWLSLLPAVLAGGLVYAYGDGHATLGLLLLVVGFVFAWLGTGELMSRYDEQAQALASWGGLAAALAILGVSYVLQPNALALANLAGTAFLSVFVLLNFLWKLLFVLMVAASVAPFLISDKRTHKAARTGRIGLLASATLFLITTLLLWSWAFHLAAKTGMASLAFDLPPALAALCESGQNMRFTSVGQCLFDVSVNRSGNWFLAMTLAALCLMIAAIVPSAWYEAVPDKAGQAPPTSSKLWQWLNNAYRPLMAAELVVLCGWLVLAIVPWVRGREGGDLPWFLAAGGLMAAAVPLAVFLRRYVPGVATALLDIMLDVSNWLRERPWDCNPRGQIMTRYVSLLQYLIQDQRYRRVVIVSYSQGTVITADTLKLLRETGVLSAWPKTEIMLLTLGCPLKQLYAARFPDWYGWAENADHHQLGVCVWANGYRTGDYVGRDLWRGGPAAMPPAVPYGTYDFCVGEGGHLHYFDGTAQLVGDEIVRLIDSPVDGHGARDPLPATAPDDTELVAQKQPCI